MEANTFEDLPEQTLVLERFGFEWPFCVPQKYLNQHPVATKADEL